MQRDIMPTSVPANDTVAAFGPYAQFQPTQADVEPHRDAEVAYWPSEVARREADVHVIAPDQHQTRHAENVVAMPTSRAQTPVQPGVDVELTRETIRYTMPVSEAVLPVGLARLATIQDTAPIPLTGTPPRLEFNADERHDTALMASKFALLEPAE